MSDPRRRTFVEIGLAVGVLIGCVIAGLILVNLGPAEYRSDSPDLPLRPVPVTMPPLTRDTYTVHESPTPRAAEPTQAPTAGRTSRATPKPSPRPTREVSLPPSRPAPEGTRSPSATASPAPAAPPVCRVRVLGICLVRG